MLYTVTWSIDVDADSPKEAARKARMYQLRGGVFDVKGKTSSRRIDLGAFGSPDGEAQAPEDELKVMHYGEMFAVREIFAASPERAAELDCEPGQPILVI